MNLLDAVALVVIGGAAIAGYRTGFLARVGGWVGALAGLLVGVRLVEPVLETIAPTSAVARLLLTLFTVLGGTVLGQSLGVFVGARARSRLEPGSAGRRTDHALGAAAGVIGVAVTLWLLAPLLARVPGPVARQARTSSVLATVTGLAPDGLNPLDGLQGLIANSPFPEVFDGLIASPEVGPPPSEMGVAQGVLDGVAVSTVNVETVGCDRVQEGSGFVVGDGLVATNAHVVAGGDSIVLLRDDGTRVPATLVGFDPASDLALLAAPELERPALSLADAEVGAPLAVFGHPGGQDQLRVAAATLGDRITATGRDIYGDERVERDVLVLASALRQGDSGSAVVDASGRVVGVTFAIAADDAGVAYALARPMLEELLARTTQDPASAGPCLR